MGSSITAAVEDVSIIVHRWHAVAGGGGKWRGGGGKGMGGATTIGLQS